jgi:hypothetical protein
MGRRRQTLEQLATLRIASLNDAELEQRALHFFWRDVDSRRDVAAATKLLLHQQLCDSCVQLRIPADAKEGRKRLRTFLQWAMVQRVSSQR